ncbi:50S ribosome-binding GTPase [Myroides odoratimimus subsp. xuanwuensis]
MLEGAKNLVTRSTDIGARVDGLESAVALARGRLDDQLVDETAATVEKAAGRLRLSADHTVVAIAGATGSGKSSTFNALTGLELSATGVRRPTTSWATACIWGREGASELLEWLGIPERHQTTRDSMLDTKREGNALDGVVLLDLPDHDSTEVSHHLEVDRLVELADMLVWVLDPQKYADAAVHERYLAPHSEHSEVMVVVLNHLDVVPEPRRAGMLDDVRRLLEADGLHDVPVIGFSAREGWGVEELKSEIAGRVKAKKATKTRLAADLRTAAERLSDASGSARPRQLPKQRIAELDDALADAAGVPIVVDAVEASTRQRAARATGWPLVAWFSRLRPDPLKRLHLDLGAAGKELTGRGRTSVPEATRVQRARVDAAVRRVADEVSVGLSQPWTASIREASVSHLPELGDRLDATLASTDLGVAKTPIWANLVRVLQWLLMLAALIGGVWLLALAVMGYLQIDASAPEVSGLALPTLLLLGGVALGIVLALVCRVLVEVTARRRAKSADRRLREGIHEVAEELVVAPVERELEVYSQLRAHLARALK